MRASLTRLYEQGGVSDYSWHFINLLTRRHGLCLEDQWIVLHLLEMAICGHVCIHEKDMEMAARRWLMETEIEAELYLEVKEALKRAKFQNLPSSLFAVTGPLVLERQRLYLKRNYEFERRAFTAFEQLLSEAEEGVIKASEAEEILEEQSYRSLNPFQSRAIFSALRNRFFVLTGGPGTGKTFTASKLMTALLTLRPELEIAITAPTGKAAANLEAAFSSSEIAVSCFTLHSLLGISKQRSEPKANARSPLPYDLIVCDESSMMDVSLFTYLLEALKPGARLILLGDPNQLPPVDSGSFFSDIVTALAKRRPDQVVELKECLRVEVQQLNQLAQLIEQRQNQAVISGLQGKFQGSDAELAKALLQAYKKQVFPMTCPEEALIFFSKYRILSAMRKGPLGTLSLNEQLFAQLPKQGKSYVPILFTANSKRFKLYNGDTAVLEFEGEIAQRAYFKDREQGELRSLPQALLPNFELAWALSIHKSQGSEYEEVYLALPKGSACFGWQLFYTGVTRAKRRIYFYGSEQTLNETLATCAARQSGFLSLLTTSS